MSDYGDLKQSLFGDNIIPGMSDYGDLKQCNHYLEALHKKTHGEDPKPGKMERFVNGMSLFGRNSFVNGISLFGAVLSTGWVCLSTG